MAKIPDLYDEFSYQGLWWFPDTPDEKWAGTLSYSSTTGINLNLTIPDEDFGKKFEPAPRTTPEIMHGSVINGFENAVTLVYCSRTGNTFTSNEVANFNYVAELIILGHWFDKFEDIRFVSVRIGYSNLVGWLRHLTYHPFSPKESTEADQTTIEVKYVEQKPIEIPISSQKYVISMGLILDGPSWGILNDFEWSESAFVSIIPDNLQKLGWYLEQSVSIRNLLAVLMGLPASRKWLSALTEDLDDGFPRAVYLYFPAKSPHSEADSNMIMPLAAEHLDTLLPGVFQAWFDKREALEALADLSLGVLYNSHQFWKFEFLTLIQACESYHQIIDPTFKKSSPRASELKERLEKLYNGLPGHLQAFVGLQGSFLNDVVNTRNYYTHYNPKKRGKALTDRQLYDAIIRLIHFVVILMYTELGVPDQKIREAILRTKGYGLWWRSTLYY